jgi:DNA-binding MarR family transcriptional regulator
MSSAELPSSVSEPPSSAAATAANGRVRQAGAGPVTAMTEEWQADLLDLGKAFRRVFRSLRRLRGRDTHLIGSEVSHAQMELLIELSEQGPLSAGELALAAQLTPATVTQMLDHLAASGHVERTRSEVDRRVVVTHLTAQGERKVQAKRALWQERWESVLADVDAGDLRTTTRVLERLNAVFEDAPETGNCEAGGSASKP